MKIVSLYRQTMLKIMTQQQFETIYRQYYEYLYKEAFIRLRHAEEARDIVQDTMLNLWQSEIEPNNLGAYLRKAVLNGVVSRLNKKGLDSRMLIVQAELDSDDTDFEAEEAKRSLLRERIEHILDNDASQRPAAAFRAVFMRGLTYDEAASQLNISRSTVNKHVVSILKLLRTKLTRYVNEDEN